MPKENKLKYGLWEDGKRIEWFNENEVQLINQGKLDYTTYFNQTDSHEMVVRNATFSRPIGLDDKLSDLKRKIAQLKAKTKSSY